MELSWWKRECSNEKTKFVNWYLGPLFPLNARFLNKPRCINVTNYIIVRCQILIRTDPKKNYLEVFVHIIWLFLPEEIFWTEIMGELSSWEFVFMVLILYFKLHPLTYTNFKWTLIQKKGVIDVIYCEVLADTIFWKWSSGEVKSMYLPVLDRYRPPRSTGQRQLKEGRLNELQDSFLVVLF